MMSDVGSYNVKNIKNKNIEHDIMYQTQFF